MRCYEMIKGLLPIQHQVTEAQRLQINATRDYKELYDVIQHGFYVVTPCHSFITPENVLEGTRLIVLEHPPDGFEIAIKTQGTPPRWKEFSNELDCIFHRICEGVIQPVSDLDICSNLILSLIFYWYQFMPLSRGTTACEFVALHGLFLALGYEINITMPKGLQMDWEGILSPTHKAFMAVLTPWMYPARIPVDPAHWDNIPNVATTFNTLRHMADVLNRKSFN